MVVIRNLAPLTKNKETYEDLEKLMARVLKELTLSREGIRVNVVRCLQIRLSGLSLVEWETRSRSIKR